MISFSDPIETVKVPATAPATQLQPVTAAESSSDEVTVVHQAPLAELEDIPPDPTDEDEEEEDNKKDSIDEKMVAASKEEMPSKKSSAEDSILSVIYTASKKVFIVGSIYLVGYMGWSIAWLIAPVILSVARDRWQKSTKHKRSIAKASALASEKEVILARIDELPAWVSPENPIQFYMKRSKFIQLNFLLGLLSRC